MTSEPTFTGCLIASRPLGMLKMRDKKGQDEEILAAPTSDAYDDHYRDLSDVAPDFLRAIECFFQIYKHPEGKPVDTFGGEGRDIAV